MRYSRGRKSLRDILAAHNASDAFYAGLAGLPPRAQSVIPEPRAKRKRSASGKPLERHVLASVLEALRAHPNVAFAWRMQSGVFQDGDRYIRVGAKGIPDIVAMLKNSGQLVGIECKRPGGYATGPQEFTLALIRANGGRAGIATCVEDALRIVAE